MVCHLLPFGRVRQSRIFILYTKCIVTSLKQQQNVSVCDILSKYVEITRFKTNGKIATGTPHRRAFKSLEIQFVG